MDFFQILRFANAVLLVVALAAVAAELFRLWQSTQPEIRYKRLAMVFLLVAIETVTIDALLKGAPASLPTLFVTIALCFLIGAYLLPYRQGGT